MTATAETTSRNARLREGLKLGVPFAIAGFLVAVSFGIVAREAGLSAVAAIVMSMIVYAGSAQFTAIASSSRAASGCPSRGRRSANRR